MSGIGLRALVAISALAIGLLGASPSVATTIYESDFSDFTGDFFVSVDFEQLPDAVILSADGELLEVLLEPEEPDAQGRSGHAKGARRR